MNKFGLHTGLGIKYAVRVSPIYEKWTNRFLNCIDKTLNSDDSWIKIGHFIYSDDDPDIIYILSTTEEIKEARNKPSDKDIYGGPANLSVTFYGKDPIEVMIDANNFITGVPISKLGKKEYRKYVINHETGHALGYGHLPCNSENQICPVMYQMTKGVPADYEPSYQVKEVDYRAPRLY